MTAYYNEIEPYAAQWLRNLIAKGLIADGEVDTRSIVDVRPAELAGFTQCHFFAGIGGWSHALRLAGWPDDRPIWTGSCPCQPFSVAGKGAGTDDPRHLWPHFHRLIAACRPPVVMGEQVAGAAGYGWLDGVRADLASEGYTCWAYDIPACAVDAPHIRNRLYWCAVADAEVIERGTGFCKIRPQQDRDFTADGDGNSAMADAELPDRRAHDDVRGSGDAAQANGRIEGAVEFGKRDAASGELVNTPSLGRSEGRTEPDLRSGRNAAAVADAQGDVGDALDARLEGQPRHVDGTGGRAFAPGSVAAPDGGDVADADGSGFVAGQRDYSAARYGDSIGAAYGGDSGSFWSDAEWIACHDGKARRTKSGLRLLVDGLPGSLGGGDDLGAITPEEKEAITKVLGPDLLVDALPGRVDLWRIAGNAIVPVLAAEVLKALMETLDTPST